MNPDKRRRPFRGQRKDRSRGAVAIEFALIVPMMALLLFGVLDFGYTFANWLAVRDGSRQGARQAVVAETGGNGSCSIVGGGAMTTSTAEAVCLTKHATGLDESDVRVKIVMGDYLRGERMAVCVQYPADSLTGIFGPVLDSKVVRSKVEMRIEELHAVPIGAVAETPHSGSNWVWCTL